MPEYYCYYPNLRQHACCVRRARAGVLSRWYSVAVMALDTISINPFIRVALFLSLRHINNFRRAVGGCVIGLLAAQHQSNNGYCVSHKIFMLRVHCFMLNRSAASRQLWAGPGFSSVIYRPVFSEIGLPSGWQTKRRPHQSAVMQNLDAIQWWSINQVHTASKT